MQLGLLEPGKGTDPLATPAISPDSSNISTFYAQHADQRINLVFVSAHELTGQDDNL